MELQRLLTSVRGSAVDSYGFSSNRHGDWSSGRAFFPIHAFVIFFCGDAHRPCDTFTRREMRCCTNDVEHKHHTHASGTALPSTHFSGTEHTPGFNNFFGYLFSFVVFCLFSERVFALIFLTFAYSGLAHNMVLFLSGNTLKGEMPGRITLEIISPASRLRRGRACLFFFAFAFSILMSLRWFAWFGVSDYDGVWLANSFDSLE